MLFLPFVEQAGFYVSVDANNYLRSGGTDPSWRALGEATVPLYLCPSDANQTGGFDYNGLTWARGNYAASIVRVVGRWKKLERQPKL